MCVCRDHYITMVKWRDDDHLMVAWSNRVQNHTMLTLCNAKSTDCQLVSMDAALAYVLVQVILATH